MGRPGFLVYQAVNPIGAFSSTCRYNHGITGLENGAFVDLFPVVPPVGARRLGFRLLP